MAYDYYNFDPTDHAIAGGSPTGAVPQMYSQTPVSTAAAPQVYAVEPLSATGAINPGVATAPAYAAAGYPGGSALADAMAAAYAANPAAMTAMTSSPYDYSFNVSSNKGNPTGEVGVTAQTPIALVDNRTGQLVYSGVGVDAAKKVQELASGLTSAGGSKATWSVYTAPAGATSADQFTQVAYEKPNKSLGSTLLSVAAPIAGTLLAGPLGLGALGLGTVGTGALGAALGSAALGTARGQAFEDILKNAAVSGAGAFAGGTLSNALGGAGQGAATAGKTIANTVKDAALSNALGSGAASAVAPEVMNQIIVNAAKQGATGAIGAGLGAGLGGLGAAALDPNAIVVTGQTPTTDINAGNIAGSTVGPIVTDGILGNEMVVTGKTEKPDLGAASIAGGLANLGLSPSTGGAGTTTTDNSNLSDTLKKAYLAANILGVLGKVAGGGGSGTGAAGDQSLQPIFSSKLPTPGEGGALKVGGLDQTAPKPQDWYRYAMGPSAQVPAGTDLSRATSPYAGYGPGTLGEEAFKRATTPVAAAHGGSMGYARGGSNKSFAVEGPGTGRSDDIPAVLSDGEYVIDAETVALLGDGSNRAGAKKLDEMRVKVRKHKGRNLAKGAFSVNAKRPEKYLSGGRA